MFGTSEIYPIHEDSVSDYLAVPYGEIMPSLIEIIKKTEGYFRDRGIDTPRLDTELLIGAVLNLDRLQLYMKFDLPLSDEELNRIRSVVRRRANREPVAYILGEKDFYAHTFFIESGVLCPRPDTETLVEQALHRIPKEGDFFVADVGAGSGCVGLSIAMERPDVKVFSTDISDIALRCTKKNVEALALTTRCAVLKGSYLDPIPPERRIDMLVSNPPYIPSADIDSLAPEVQTHEPRLALDGGDDGLHCYRALAVQARSRNIPWVLLELGIGQDESVRSIFMNHGYNTCTLHNDLSGVPRVLACCVEETE
jgi:release factor glutamine methyltransferase